jgi:birA, biotin-[acetyl-CoA-carboxylase] ligase region
MAISLAIAEALEKEGFVDIQLKWPNDIVFHFQKLGGVLVELNNETSGVTDAVIGIGLNLYFPRAAREPIARAVTDLYSIQHVMPDRNVLLAAIMMELANTLTVYAQKGFAAFASSWQKRHIYHQRAVRLLLPDQQIVKGIALGIDADGALILGEPSADKDKAARYTAGEISLYPA